MGLCCSQNQDQAHIETLVACAGNDNINIIYWSKYCSDFHLRQMVFKQCAMNNLKNVKGLLSYHDAYYKPGLIYMTSDYGNTDVLLYLLDIDPNFDKHLQEIVVNDTNTRLAKYLIKRRVNHTCLVGKIREQVKQYEQVDIHQKLNDILPKDLVSDIIKYY